MGQAHWLFMYGSSYTTGLSLVRAYALECALLSLFRMQSDYSQDSFAIESAATFKKVLVHKGVLCAEPYHCNSREQVKSGHQKKGSSVHMSVLISSHH